jgi:hypothetical protein
LPESQIYAAGKGRSARALRPRVDFYTDLQKETEMELRTECAPDKRQECAKRGDSYIVTDGQAEGGFLATITPIHGLFNVEVIEEEYELVSDAEMFDICGTGTYYERYEHTRLKTGELTVEDVQKALDQFDIKLPDRLAEELSEWRRKCLEANAEDLEMARTESGDDIDADCGEFGDFFGEQLSETDRV